MRGVFARMASLFAMSVGMMANAKPAPPVPPRPTSKRRDQNVNNPRGTVRNRGLKRIQGRQAAK